jgi:pimeloyl-ACP methyl ester carboxylesterase
MIQKDMTVVLVHGAWADGSSWRDVIAPVQAAGLKAVSAPLPLVAER